MATNRPARAAPPLAAYVLHSWDWSESSLVVELFTRERGRIAVVAKGAKRPHSNLRPVLLPFQRLHAQLGRAARAEGDDAEVQPLRAAEWAGGLPMPGGAALFAGFYLNELLLKLLARHDAHPALFDAYADAVDGLHGDEAGRQLALRAFELVLLRETGVLPDLAVQTQTLQDLQPDARYLIDPESGVRPGSAQAGVPGAALVRIESALAQRDTAALRLALQPAAGSIRGPLRQLLQYHLGSPTLRSRRVMVELQQLIDSEAPRR